MTLMSLEVSIGKTERASPILVGSLLTALSSGTLAEVTTA